MVKGQKAGHSFPSKPIGPISKNHYLTLINVIITLLGIRHFKRSEGQFVGQKLDTAGQEIPIMVVGSSIHS